MKRRSIKLVLATAAVLLGGVICATGQVHAEETDIPIDEMHFPDPAFRNFVKNDLSLNPDQNDVLSAEEIQATKELILSGVGISQFDGLSYFTELQRLECGGNNAGILDLRQNTKLELLNCSDCNIGSLDISQNTELKALDCSSNSIYELDLSGHTNLKKLNCKGCNIKELDISETGLSLSNWNTLDGGFYTDFQIDIFTGDERKRVDTSYFPDTKFCNYISIVVDQNRSGWLGENEIRDVKTIDVGHQNIQSLSGVELFTELKTLYCQENQLTELPILKLTKLTDLNCSNNQLTELPLADHTKLKYLACSDNQLTKLNLKGLSGLLKLGCAHNKLSVLDVSGNAKLVFLNCSENQLKTLDVLKNTKLEELVCGNNNLQTLKLSNPNMTMLLCEKNSLSELDVSNMTKLQTLVCYENQLSDLYVRNNKQLKELGCNSNHLTSLDISQNAELNSLSACNSGLEYLVIVKNPLLIKDYTGERSEKQKYRDGYCYTYRDYYSFSVDTKTKVVADKIGWKKSGSKYWYLYMDGTYAKNDWVSKDGKWYYFGSDGYMVTGWKKIRKKWFYFSSQGEMQTGWKSIGGKWYHFSKNGDMQLGWQKISKKWYYFRPDGTMAVKEYRDGYWLNKNGVCTGFLKAVWRRSGKNWWFGDGIWYAKEQWLTIDGIEYYFMKNGFLATSQWIGDYYVGSDGAYVGKRPKTGELQSVSVSNMPDYKGMVNILEHYGQFHRYWNSERPWDENFWTEMFFYSDLRQSWLPITCKTIKGSDPLGKSPGSNSHYRVSEKDAKWYLHNVINVSQDMIKLNQRKADANYYLYNGYYYFWQPGIGGPGYEVTNVSIMTDGPYYYVDYTLHLLNSKTTYDDMRFHAKIGRRYSKGKSFWSIYEIVTGE